MQKRLPFEKKKRLIGYVFISPWLIGVLLFFLQPLVQTVNYCFQVVTIKPEGGLSVTPLDGNPFQYFIDAFTRDPDFMWWFNDAIVSMLYAVPSIIVFSLFIANILCAEFKGRIFMRAVFFLPVIVASGIVIDIIQNGLNSVGNNGAFEAANIFNPASMTEFLLNSGFPGMLVDYISAIVSSLIDLVWKSGIQILVFMAGVLAIPPSYYEVAAVEGATGWESFWKITFPLIIPHIMINLIYTIVELLSSFDNKVIRYIIDTIYRKVQFSYGSALSWLYFLTVMLFVGVLFFLIGRLSHREAD